MPKKITKWEANDGSEWKTEKEAITRDELLEKIEKAMEPLGKNQIYPIVNLKMVVDTFNILKRQSIKSKNHYMNLSRTSWIGG